MSGARRAAFAMCDLHVDTLSELLRLGGNFNGPRPDLQVDVARLRAGSVRLLLFACFTRDGQAAPEREVARMLELAAALDADPACPLRRVTTPAEVAALAPDEIGFLLTIENAQSLAGDVGALEYWRAAGVRIVGLTWNGANDLGCGVLAAQDRGLTDFGREVVREIARLGMAVDLSHLAPRGVHEVLELDVPVLATHSNARAICDHPRNLSDVQLRGIAARDGVVGVVCFPPFLTAAEYAGLTDMVRHAQHLASILGAERVALGTDFDGIQKCPVDFGSHADAPRFAERLRASGFDAAAVGGILGRNYLEWWSRWSR
ncbi:MAG: dipeptidase [Planctomycetota bacterium]